MLNYAFLFIFIILCGLYYVLCFFFNVSDENSFFSGFWVFVFLLLVTPFSFPLFYKLGVCALVFYSSFYVLFMWSLYNFSEQFFLFKLGGDYFYSGVYNCWL